MVRAVIVSLISTALLSGAALAQTAPLAATGVPPAPVGHAQPNAATVPPGDSAAGSATAPGSPIVTTPQEQRDNQITHTICGTATC